MLDLAGVASIRRRCKTSRRGVSSRRAGKRPLTMLPSEFLYIKLFRLSIINPLVSIQAETAWAMTVLGYLAKLVLGVLG